MKDKIMNKQQCKANTTQQDAEWFAKLQSDSLSPNDSAEFCEWLAEKPSHEQGLEECEAAWDLLGSLKGEPDLDCLLAEYQSEDLPSANKISPWHLNHFAQAASVAVIAIAIGLLFSGFSNKTYQTAVGEQRLITLEDGSTVFLNSHTLIEVNYSNRLRSIELERGEALFNVAHNKIRPFEVTTGNRLTRAVGTSFNIAMRNQQTTVSVLEGVIEIEPTHERMTTTTLPQLVKGDEISYWANGANTDIHAADLEKIVALTQGKIIFEDQALSQVIEEYNKYSSKPMIIGSAHLNNIMVTGIFRINDADALLFILEESFDIEHINSDEKVVLVPKS